MRFAIFTSGHSGSSWLARALTRPDEGMAVFHESVRHLAFDVVEQELRGEARDASALRRSLASYAHWLRFRERQFDVLGEVHTGPWSFWLDVEDLLPGRRFLTVRNPVQVVHSITAGFIHKGTPEERLWAKRLASPRFDGLAPEQRIFAGACTFWSQQRELVDKLRIEEWVRFEDLVSTASKLPGVSRRWTGRDLGQSQAAEFRNEDVKRKIPGDNRPANLFWNVWTDWMRETFLDICGPGMDFFGYAAPARADAPREPDLAPARPIEAAPFSIGSLSPLWVFTSNPALSSVLVCGRRSYAAAAAGLLHGTECWLLREEGWSDDNAPGGASLFTLEQASLAPPAGIFVAEPAPAAQWRAELEARFPRSEIVFMLPAPLSDEQLAAITERGRRNRQGWARNRSPGSSAPAFGPLCRGERIEGWRLEALHPAGATLRLTLVSDAGDRADLEIRKQDAPHHHVPFPIGDGGLYYRPVPFPFQLVEPSCRAIAERVQAALDGRTLRQAFDAWERAARSAAPVSANDPEPT